MLKSALILLLVVKGTLSIAQTEQDSIILIDKLQIFYASDRFELTEEHKKLLSEFFDYQNTRELEFHIDAYTDADGDDEYNKQLSIHRTEAIVLWLKEQNVDEDRIIKVGHGEQLASHDTESALKAKDRRSEIRVYQNAPYKLFEGAITLDQDGPIENLEISIFDNGVKRKVTIDEGVNFSIKAPLNREVELQFEAKDHFPTVKKLKLSSRSKVSKVKIPLVKMEEGAIVLLHLQFIGNKSLLLPRFKGSLVTLASILKKSPSKCLELSGHVNHPGPIITDREHPSFGLSIARSIEIHDYLVEAGIDKDRILARGYCNSRMIYPKAKSSEEGSANRRVEAKVMSCDSTSIIPNDFVKDIEFYKRID